MTSNRLYREPLTHGEDASSRSSAAQGTQFDPEVVQAFLAVGRRGTARRRLVPQSGMLPCLRGGRRSRFVIAVFSASISTGRVRRGSITSST